LAKIFLRTIATFSTFFQVPVDNFQFGYKQKLPKKTKNTGTSGTLFVQLIVGGKAVGSSIENGQATWAPQPPPCVLAGSSQSGRAAKERKEGTSFSLSLSLSLSCCRARSISSVIFVVFC
jgi:hypothetical protein